MLYAFLFVFGLLIGSFLNVVALRYDGDHMVGDPNVIGGRSRCPHCGKTLQWYELIPVISFVIQNRRCRNCKATIGWQYPLVELISACIFAFVPLQTFMLTGPGEPFVVLSTFWVIAFELFLLVAYIDIRLGIIPDELNGALGILGIFMNIFIAGYFGVANHSLLGVYAGWFGLQQNIWINHIAAAALGAAFFALLILVTRGKGMGMGDVKLAVPLGLIFGWPDIVPVVVLAFIIGALAGVALIARGRKTMKGSLPFAPFLIAGATIVFFAGFRLAAAYFGLLV
jgi:prepilin signal peptidase PulO-like enzyme (type II secretory pathway)